MRVPGDPDAEGVEQADGPAPCVTLTPFYRQTGGVEQADAARYAVPRARQRAQQVTVAAPEFS